MFSDAGPDVRWVGNENGTAGDPCWATLDLTAPGRQPGGSSQGPDHRRTPRHRLGARRVRRLHPPRLVLPRRRGRQGQDAGRNCWTCTSSRSGEGAVLNLNVPPDRRGRLHEPDVQEPAQLRPAPPRHVRRRTSPARPPHPPTTSAAGRQRRLRRRPCHRRRPRHLLVLRRRRQVAGTGAGVAQAGYVQRRAAAGIPAAGPADRGVRPGPLGGRESDEKGDGSGAGKEVGRWTQFAAGTSVGNCRLLRVPPVTTRRLRLRVTKSPVCPTVSELGLFAAPDTEGQGGRTP